MGDVKKMMRATIPENRELSDSGIVLEMMAAATSWVEEREGQIGLTPWAAALEEMEKREHHA